MARFGVVTRASGRVCHSRALLDRLQRARGNADRAAWMVQAGYAVTDIVSALGP